MPKTRSLSARMTAKVGPLPVWTWAVAILVVGYLIYRHTSSGSSSSTSSSSDSTAPAPPDSTSGTPGPDVAGGATSTAGPDAASLNDQLLSQLSGFGSSVDALTQAVLSSEAFLPGTGDSGSGSIVPNGTPTPPPSAVTPPEHTTTTTAPAKPPVAKPAAKKKPAPVTAKKVTANPTGATVQGRRGVIAIH